MLGLLILVAGVDAVGGRVGVVGCGPSDVHDDEVDDNLPVVGVASVGDPVVALTLRFTCMKDFPSLSPLSIQTRQRSKMWDCRSLSG